MDGGRVTIPPVAGLDGMEAVERAGFGILYPTAAVSLNLFGTLGGCADAWCKSMQYMEQKNAS